MKVLAIIGSPREHGNTTALVNAVIRGAESAGHEVEIVNLTNLSISDCVACCKCKISKDRCSIHDDMQNLYPKIEEADCLVIGTPVYMGQMTGKMKSFFDRWYTFMDADYQIHDIPGKKYITITCSGAPAEVFQSLTDYFNHWLGSFFKMELVKNIVAGGLGAPAAINAQPELIRMAETTGRSLK